MPHFREWKQNTFEAVCTTSGRPKRCFKRVRAVDQQGVKFEDLADGEDFDALDAKFATALTNLPRNNDLKRQVTKAKEAAQLKDELVEWQTHPAHDYRLVQSRRG